MKVKTRMKTEIVLTDKEREILKEALKITTDIYEICDDVGADRGNTFTRSREGCSDSIEKDEMKWLCEYLERIRWAYSINLAFDEDDEEDEY